MIREERKGKREKRVAPGYFLGNTVMVFLLIFFASSCQDVKKPVKPQNLISQETMVSILTEVYISNAARSVNLKLIKEYHIKLDSVVYEKYEIDSLQFAESNAFYSSDLKIYTKIITSVEERLNILKIEKDSVYEAIKKEKGDTIKSKEKEDPKLLVDPVENGVN